MQRLLLSDRDGSGWWLQPLEVPCRRVVAAIAVGNDERVKCVTWGERFHKADELTPSLP